MRKVNATAIHTWQFIDELGTEEWYADKVLAFFKLLERTGYTVNHYVGPIKTVVKKENKYLSFEKVCKLAKEYDSNYWF